MVLRLSRHTFQQGWIILTTATGQKDRREYTDYDRFQQAAARAMSNPLVYSSYCAALYGNTAKRMDPDLDFLDYPHGYDDGHGTEWQERRVDHISRDPAMNLRTTRWSPNYDLDQKHKIAGEPKEWLWLKWVVTDLSNYSNGTYGDVVRGILVDEDGNTVVA
jgi:hypothetical protein